MHRKALYLLILILVIFIAAGCGSDNLERQFDLTPEPETSEQDYTNIEDKVYFAIDAGDYEEAKKLLASDENISVDNSRAAKDLSGDPRILFSVYPEHEELSRLLIDYGADLNGLGSKGCSYLHLSVAYSEEDYDGEIIEITEYILKKGADPDVNGSGDFKGTPVDYLMTKSPVFIYNFDRLYNMFVKYDADITINTLENALNSDSGFTYAKDIVKRLKENNIETGLGDALEAILLDKNKDEIIRLIKNGSYRHKDKKYMVWYAAANCDAEVLQCLKNTHFNMKCRNSEDMSLLDIAAAYNEPEVVEYLIGQGFDINDKINLTEQNDTDRAFEQSCDLKKYTPLSFALVHGKIENAQRLIDAGAEFQRNSWINAVFSQNKEAVDILMSNSFEQEESFLADCYIFASDEMVKYLMYKGLSCDLSYEGENIISFLRKAGMNDRADLILKYKSKINGI